MRKRYAVTDLHGCYELWEAIKNYCGEKDNIIFLGDAIDRGEYGLAIMQELLEDKRVDYILGNHEEMFLKAIQEYLKDFNEFNLLNSFEYNHCYMNSGSSTFKDFLNLPKDEQIKLYQSLKRQGKKYMVYKNKEGKEIFLSHSGCSFKDLFNLKEADLTWNRDHIKEPDYLIHSNLIMVHGHTPVQFITHKNEIYKYFNESKIDIDLGCVESGIAALLDLDTLEPIYFKIDKGDKNE